MVAPVPENVLPAKSNDLPVIWSTVAIAGEVPVIFATAGRKSKQSLKGKVPVGSGASGSTFVAE